MFNYLGSELVEFPFQKNPSIKQCRKLIIPIAFTI